MSAVTAIVAAGHAFPSSVYRFPTAAAVQDALAREGLAEREPVLRTIGRATIAFHVARRGELL